MYAINAGGTMSDLHEITITVDDDKTEWMPFGARTTLVNVLKAVRGFILRRLSESEGHEGHESFWVTENGSAIITIQAIKLVSQLYPDAVFHVDIAAPMGYASGIDEGIKYNDDSIAIGVIKNGIVTQEPEFQYG